MSTAVTNLYERNEFLIRRLHSLSGLLPVGAYMTVHLLVNASLLNGPGTFQSNVNQIHSLGGLLPFVEWGFIFIPIIFHAAVGVWILRSGKTNQQEYRYLANWRYSLQRWTGVIAVVFIFFHVFHLHGWFHADWWLSNVAEPLGMAQFRAYNASSTLGLALGGILWPLFYLIGVTACVYHFANGVWTMGITWGVWVSPAGQKYAGYACTVAGVGLQLVGMASLVAAVTVDVSQARQVEDAMYESKVASGELIANPHKRSSEASHETSDSSTESSPASEPPEKQSEVAEGQDTGNSNGDGK